MELLPLGTRHLTLYAVKPYAVKQLSQKHQSPKVNYKNPGKHIQNTPVRVKDSSVTLL